MNKSGMQVNLHIGFCSIKSYMQNEHLKTQVAFSTNPQGV